MEKVIRIGTRGSKLALAQTAMVIRRLQQKYPEWKMETVIMHTQGDKILDKPLIDFGGKGVFITEFEEALLEGRIDLAVHSSKDMPMDLAEGLVIAGVLPREDARDILVTKKGLFPVKDIYKGENGEPYKDTSCPDFSDITVGTGSLRRQFQLKKLYSGINCISIRGNVPTRLQKIREGQCDGVVLAAAGLSRLGLLEKEEFDYHYFSYEEMIPAGGQGIIAIEGRAKDEITGLVECISDEKSYYELETERAILQQLEAGCHEAIGVISRIEQDIISIRIIREQNGTLQKQEGRVPVNQRLELARELVKRFSFPCSCMAITIMERE